MELSKIIRPLSKRQRYLVEKDLLKTINIALKISCNLTDMSYGKISANEYAIGVNISSVPLIQHMKYDIEKLGFSQTPSKNEYQDFVYNAFKHNKLFFTCKNAKISDDYAINPKHIRIDVSDDPRLFNSRDQTGIQFKIEFLITPLTPKAKKRTHVNQQQDALEYAANPVQRH